MGDLLCYIFIAKLGSCLLHCCSLTDGGKYAELIESKKLLTVIFLLLRLEGRNILVYVNT